jgi:flagellar biosynthesis/type III secretory pathway protein FliH
MSEHNQTAVEAEYFNTLDRGREAGFTEGYAQGLEAAAKMIASTFGDKPELDFYAKKMRDEAIAVRSK